MGGKVYGTRGKGRKMSKKKGRGGEGKFRGGQAPQMFFPTTAPGSQVLERPSTWLYGRRLPSRRPRSSWFTVSRQHDAGHPSHDDVTGRAFAVAGPRVWNSLPPAIRDPSLIVVVNLRKTAKNLVVV